MMKRLWVALIATFLIGIFALAVQPTAANVSQLDQQNESGVGSIRICTGSRMMQYFKPTLNRLDSVTINVADASGTVSLAIKSHASGSWQDIATVSNQPAVDGWNVFDFEDVAVTPESDYTISVSADCTDNNTKWYYANNNPYARGFAVWQSTDYPEWDFQFQTFGMNITTPSDTSADTSETSGPTATGETLGTATSAIEKPTNLKATFAEAGATSRGVKLIWDISKTADIYGYKIYRSEEATKGFVKIGQITKESFAFLDTNIVASKKYYYQVRAYRGEEQSYSSNTASVEIPADIGPAKPANFKVTAFDTKSITVVWDKNQETNIAGYNVAIYEDSKQVEAADVDKNTTSYNFSDLSADTVYRLTLIVRDENIKISPESSIIQATAPGSRPLFSFNRWVGLLAGLALALTLLLTYSIIKRRRKAKIVKL